MILPCVRIRTLQKNRLKSLLSLCLVLLLALTRPTGVWAAEPPPSAQAQAVIELIDTGLQDHQQEIAVLSQGLTITERERIFFQRQKQPGLPMILNAYLVGFGVGSFVVGDATGGYIGFLSEISLLSIISVLAFPLRLTSDAERESAVISQNPVFWGALVALIGMRLFGLIRPIFFVHGYNQDLQAALDYSPTREETIPQPPAPELAPYLDSQGGGGFQWGWVF
jgi:hypothetical protein